MQVTTRTDRSAATAIIYGLLRPFASQLTKIRKVYDAGSPRLNPPKSAYKHCKIEERKVADIWVYDITAKGTPEINGDKKTKRIYYFAGGSWQTPPKGEHFDLLSTLANTVSAPTVISLVSCPLAPNSPAEDAFPKLVSLYHALFKEPAFSEEYVCFAGDSSGGNIVLALTMYCLSEDSSTGAPAHAPDSLFLICPTVDLLHEDPEIESVEKKDPIESLQLIQKTGDAWAGNWDKHDPRLSPLQGTVKVLADHGVQVNGIIAGYDVLSCEAKTFVKHCEEAGVEGHFLVWDRQMHVFPLLASYHVPEAKEAVAWMVETIEQSALLSNSHKNATVGEGRIQEDMLAKAEAKNDPGARHGHRFVGKNDRQIEVTTSGYADEDRGRDAATMKEDAGRLARHKALRAAETTPKGHHYVGST